MKITFQIADTNNVGLVEALTLGSTRLVARCVGEDKVTGKKIAYSEDQVRKKARFMVYLSIMYRIIIHDGNNLDLN